MRTPQFLLYLGIFMTVFLSAICIWGLLEDSTPEEMPAALFVMMGIMLLLLGIFPMFCTIPGVWEVLVKDDDIECVKLWIFRKKFRFSDIVRCKCTRGGFKFYVKDRRRKAFFVDKYFEDADLFMKRVKSAEIEMT